MSEQTNILVVDDEEIVRRAHLRTLTSAHCNVKLVLNGEEALREMERHPFDVVLLDLRMPGMDGMSVLRTIKEKWPESEVIIITGYPSVETAKEAIRIGAYDYLAKPVGPDDVIGVTSAAMTQKKWALHRERAASGEQAVGCAGPASNRAVC
jgi:DNA-binding NtrC family response regulator